MGQVKQLAPERERVAAGKLFIQEIKEHISRREDFAFETTLSGRSYIRWISEMQKDGWIVELIYLALPNVEMAKLRVAERVAHGGHNIPEDDIERRFQRSLRNLFNHFTALADSTLCFMNIGDAPELIFEQQNEQRNIAHDDFFRLILGKAGL